MGSRPVALFKFYVDAWKDDDVLSLLLPVWLAMSVLCVGTT